MAKIMMRVQGNIDIRRAIAANNAALIKASDDALGETAETVREDTWGTSPVLSGRLRDSFKVFVTNERNRLARQIGTSVFYFPFVHDGTRFRPGRPFFLSAGERGRKTFMRNIRGIKP